MNEPEPSALFVPNNLDIAEMGPGRWAALAAWAGPASVLFPARLFLVLVASLLPTEVAPRWMARAAGIRVRVQGPDVWPESGHIFVANHLSYWDAIVLRAALRTGTPPATLVWYRVNLLNQAMGRPVLRVHETGKNRELLRLMKAHLKSGNLLVFPEATVTDGRGVLRFDRAVFTLGAPVVAATVRYRRALPYLHPTSLRERLIVQAMLEFLQPWIDADVTILGRRERGPEEDAEAFADRCQREIAEALGVPATRYTWRERRKLLKALGREVVHTPDVAARGE